MLVHSKGVILLLKVTCIVMTVFHFLGTQSTPQMDKVLALCPSLCQRFALHECRQDGSTTQWPHLLVEGRTGLKVTTHAQILQNTCHEWLARWKTRQCTVVLFPMLQVCQMLCCKWHANLHKTQFLQNWGAAESKISG